MHKPLKPSTTLTENGLLRSVSHESASAAGLVVADEAVLEMRVDDVARALHRLVNQAGTIHVEAGRLALASPTTRKQRVVAGMRYLLPADEGSGYWDFFSVSDHLLISITDTTYRRNRWLPVDDSHYFKLRFLLCGRLLNRKLEAILDGGKAVAHVSPRSTESGGGYFVEGGQPTRMVVLHCRKELLTEALRFDPADIPPPFDLLLRPPHDEISQKLAFGPKVLRAVRDMVDSRHELPMQLRTSYLEAKAMEILCQVAADLVNRNNVRRLDVRVSPRELNCIYEARDYLVQHFVAPPTISKLARMVGINQTKLKAGFKLALGVTIYHFIIRLRMEQASALLFGDEHSISEVAYLVGYDYPANFTYAFKKHFGVLPKAWKNRRNRSTAASHE